MMNDWKGNRAVAGLLLAALLLCAPAGFAAQQFEGELDVVQVDDFDGDRSEIHYGLREKGSQKIKPLKFKKAKPDAALRTGQKVRVHGRALGKEIEVDQLEVLPLDGNGADAGAGPDAALGTELRKAVVLMVDLLDAKASSRYTRNQIAGLMYYNAQSVDGVYRASSFNQIGFVDDTDGDGAADVFGPFQIGYNAADSCDYYAWAQAADSAAQASGIDLSQYRHRVYVLPRHNSLPKCSWAGLGNLGCGSTCRAWIAEGESGMVYAHELGHNLGMHHAGTDPENDGRINSEYGDYSGIMGSNRTWRQANSPHRDQLNWPDAFASSLVEARSNGVHDLYPLELDPGFGTVGTQVVKIPKSDSNEFYYLSYRKQIGAYGTATSYANRVSVHRYLGSGSVRTALITTIGQGESFSDPVNGISVQVLAAGGDTATVQVGRVSSCVAGAPQLSIGPALQSAPSGTTLSYSVSITNGDSADCIASTFALQGSLAAGLSGALQPSTVTLSPGERRSIGWQVASGAGISDGEYRLALTVSDAAGTGHAPVSAAAVYRVDDTAPSAPAELTAFSIRKRVQLSWQPSTDQGSGIRLYRVLRNGESLGTTLGTSYMDGSARRGQSYVYTVVAEDMAGNVSAPSNPTDVGATTTASRGKKR